MMTYGVGMGYGWIFMVLFWALLIAVVVWAVTRLVPGNGSGSSGAGGNSTTTTSRETPMDILDRRLATGEIDADEYARIRAALNGSPTTEK